MSISRKASSGPSLSDDASEASVDTVGRANPGRAGNETLCSSILLLCIPTISSSRSSCPCSPKYRKELII